MELWNDIVGRISAKYWLDKGINLGEKRKYGEAIDAFHKALKINPNYTDALGNLGVALVNQGKYDEAIREYDKALRIEPKDEDLLNRKFSALVTLGKIDEAIQTYLMSIEAGSGWAINNIDPRADPRRNHAGVFLAKREKYDSAIVQFDKAIKFYPHDSNAWNNKGVVLGILGRYEEAIEAYNKAIDSRPWSARAWYNKGNALRLLGRIEEAEGAFDKARDAVRTHLHIDLDHPEDVV